MTLRTTSVLLVVCVCSFAHGGRAQDASAKHSITGCLRAGSAPNSYMIAHRQKGAPRSVGIVSSSTQLAPHLGEEVEITGELVSAKQAEADPNVPRAAHYMKVMAIKKIADSCP
jgi:hypothetical protein